MTAINFPSSPSLNDTYSFLGNTWRYDGVGWILESTPSSTKLNLSFNTANSASSYANGAFASANTADQKAVSAGSYANAAFNAANNASSGASDSFARDTANSASSYANGAFAAANSASGGGVFELSLQHESFIADGNSNTFTLTTEPLNENYTLVTINGVVQHKSSYSISSSNVIFSEVPTLNNEIDVVIFSSANSISEIFDSANSASSYANSAYNTANNSLNVSTGGTITGNIVVGGNIVPTTDNTYFLGSDTNRWHSLYVSDGSIYIGDLVLSNDANKLAVTDAGGNKVTISSNSIVLGDFVLSSTGAITGDVIITGNLSVTGTLADLQVTGLTIDDNIIDINEATLGAPTVNAGLRVKRGDENSVLLRWNETNDRWEFTNDGTAYSNIASAAAESYANSAYGEANTRATITYVDNAIANLVNSAPVTLDTLNELSIALNNDPSFATTVATNIGIIGSYANSAYDTANTATTAAAQADQRAVTSGLYANSAYGAANNSLNVQSGGTISGDLTINANLSVSGCTATLTVTTFRTTDHIIDLGYNTSGDPTQNAGIRVLRGEENPVQIRWIESEDYWEYTNDGSNYIKFGSYSDGVYANAAYAKANTVTQEVNNVIHPFLLSGI